MVDSKYIQSVTPKPDSAIPDFFQTGLANLVPRNVSCSLVRCQIGFFRNRIIFIGPSRSGLGVSDCNRGRISWPLEPFYRKNDRAKKRHHNFFAARWDDPAAGFYLRYTIKSGGAQFTLPNTVFTTVPSKYSRSTAKPLSNCY